MALVSSWEQKGIETGIEIGKKGLVVRKIKRRLGSVVPEVMARLDFTSADQLDDLGEALLDFTSAADLDNRLACH